MPNDVGKGIWWICKNLPYAFFIFTSHDKQDSVCRICENIDEVTLSYKYMMYVVRVNEVSSKKGNNIKDVTISISMARHIE